MDRQLPLASALVLGYLTGVVLFTIRFLVRLFQLYRITRRFGITIRHGRRVVSVDRGYAPFSFFGLTFIHEPAIPGGSLEAVLAHEAVHIRQLHSLDLALVEITTILQWFNPVVWLTANEMKTIHEFLADEGVLQHGVSRTSYQQMILDATMGVGIGSLTNHFNVSLLKKRIVMMTKPKSNIWAAAKLLLALPAVATLFIVLTAGTYRASAPVNMDAKPAIIKSEALPLIANAPQEKQKQPTQVKYVAPVVSENGVYTVVEKLPSYTGGDDARIKFLVANIKYPEEALKKGTTGTVYVTFVVRADGSITNVKVLRGIGSGCDEEAVRVVSMMPKWNPGEQKGKKVDVQFNLPIKFALDCGKKDEPKK
jgi:TonB family protein